MTERTVIAWRGGQREAGEIIIKEHRETFEDDEYVHCLDCSSVFIGLHIFQTYQIVHLKYMQFAVCQLVNYTTVKLF